MANFDPNIVAFQREAQIAKAENNDADPFRVFISNRALARILELPNVAGILFYEALARRSSMGVLLVGVDTSRDVATPFFINLSNRHAQKLSIEKAAQYIAQSPLHAYFSKGDILETLNSGDGEGIWVETGVLKMNDALELEPIEEATADEKTFETIVISASKAQSRSADVEATLQFKMSPNPCPPRCPDDNDNE